jgi:hypothetical protein
MWGVKVGLFLPLNILAISEERRPNVCPVASITYHFLSIVDGLAIKLFIGLPPYENVFSIFFE